MKKGGVVPEKAAAPAPASKRRRSESLQAAQAPEPSGNLGLGGASKDWKLPDVPKAGLNFVDSWADAVDKMSVLKPAKELEQPKQQQQQQQFQMNVPTYPTMSSIKASSTGAQSYHHQTQQRQCYGKGDAHSVSTTTTAASTISGSHRSVASTVTNSTAGSSLGSFVTNSTGGSSRGPYVTSQTFASFADPPRQTPQPTAMSQTANAIMSLAAPKAELYQFYGRKPRRQQLSNEDYLVWNNGGKPHELKFTCIFHCPLTGECFPAGRFGDPRFYVVEQMRNHAGQTVEVIWYTKKTLAEHGAACRTMDCLQYREALNTGQIVPNPLGSDKAYTRDVAPDLPPVPPAVAQKIEELNRRVVGMPTGFP